MIRKSIGQKIYSCDTCGKPVSWVSRVIIDKNYDRSMSKAIYNCPDCFKKKEKSRLHSLKSQSPDSQ